MSTAPALQDQAGDEAQPTAQLTSSKRDRQKHSTERLKAFTRAWLSNGQRSDLAARSAGVVGTPGAIRVTACRLLQRARKLGLIQTMMDRAAQSLGQPVAMTPSEVLQRLALHARGGQILRETHKRPDKETGELRLALVVERETDPRPALMDLAKIYGLDGGPSNDAANARLVSLVERLLEAPGGALGASYRAMLGQGAALPADAILVDPGAVHAVSGDSPDS